MVNVTVVRLDVASNAIGVFGAEHIAEALKANTTVTELNLRSNEIGAFGALHIAEALKVNSTVTQLDSPGMISAISARSTSRRPSR